MRFTGIRETGRGPLQEGAGDITPAPHYTLVISARQGDDSLNVELWTGDKSRLVIMDTGIEVTIARPGITEGVPEREMVRPYFPQINSVGYFPFLKEEFVELALGRSSLTTCLFFNKITDELILWLDALHDHDASLDLGCRMLRLNEKEVSL
jgi:hypothetical protein